METPYQYTLPYPVFFFDLGSDYHYRKRVYPARYGRWLLKLYGVFDDEMAKNNKNQTSFVPVEFVRIDLDNDQAANFKKWAEKELANLPQHLSNFISEDMKIGLMWDDGNNCFIASATCKDEKSDNHNCCMTSRSDDWPEALLLLVYKHEVVAKGKEWRTMSRPVAWG